MLKFWWNKLVRSRVTDKITRLDPTVVVKEQALNQAEYIVALQKKIVEEAAEVFEEKELDPMLNELADLFEAGEALLTAIGYSKADLMTRRHERNLDRGDFSKPSISLYSLMDPKSKAPYTQFLIKYFRANVDRYPEEVLPAAPQTKTTNS